jgi:uncharacterized membrane protein YcjF (UPF0283 family)
VILCWLASYVDAWAASNWKLFTKFNYFNRGGGVFVAVVYAAPMMLNAMLILINFLRELARLLVVVKREQIRRQQNADANAKNNKPDNKSSSTTNATNATNATNDATAESRRRESKKTK